MQKVLWIITIIFSILGALAMFDGFVAGNTSSAIFGIGLIIFPYVVSRSVSEIKK